MGFVADHSTESSDGNPLPDNRCTLLLVPVWPEVRARFRVDGGYLAHDELNKYETLGETPLLL